MILFFFSGWSIGSVFMFFNRTPDWNFNTWLIYTIGGYIGYIIITFGAYLYVNDKLKTSKTINGICGKDIKINKILIFGTAKCEHAKFRGIIKSSDDIWMILCNGCPYTIGD